MHTPRALWWLLFASSSLAYDWWIDQSCETKLGAGAFNDMLLEAVETAKSIRTRLDSGDENMLKAFKQIASFDYNIDDAGEYSEQLKYFRRVLGDTSPGPTGGVTAFRPSPQPYDQAARAASYLRVYCNEGEHWKPRDDDRNLPNPNTERSSKDKEYLDVENEIIAKGEACGLARTRMTVVGGNFEKLGALQNSHRYIMDICDFWIKGPQPPDPSKPYTRFDLVPELPVLPAIPSEAAPLDTPGVELIYEVGSMQALHELSHALLWFTKDPVYRFDDVCDLDPETSVHTADTYSLLGAVDQFLEQKYKLDPERLETGDMVYDAALP